MNEKPVFPLMRSFRAMVDLGLTYYCCQVFIAQDLKDYHPNEVWLFAFGLLVFLQVYRLPSQWRFWRESERRAMADLDK
jgi:hypothetical protein